MVLKNPDEKQAIGPNVHDEKPEAIENITENFNESDIINTNGNKFPAPVRQDSVSSTNSNVSCISIKSNVSSTIIEMERKFPVINGLDHRFSCPATFGKGVKDHIKVFSVPSLVDEFFARKRSTMEQEAMYETNWQQSFEAFKEKLTLFTIEDDQFDNSAFLKVMRKKVS